MRDPRLQSAAKLLMSGRPEEAEALLGAVHQEGSSSAEACHLWGLAALQAGRYEAAVQRLRQGVRLGPDVADYHFNLAGACYCLERWEQAADSYRTATRLGRDFFEAWKGLGAALLKLGRMAEAEIALRRSLEINPKQSKVWVDLADALIGQNHANEAIEVLQRALAIQEDCVDAHSRLAELFHQAGHRQNEATARYNLGSIFWRHGQAAEATQAFEQTLRLDSANGRAQHALATLRGETPRTAPREYVVDLFDKYAAHFDSHLNLLQYQVPQQMRLAITRPGVNLRTGVRVLDLGCGSGKCGTLFRDLASHVCGIDLAPRMIEQAKRTAAFDELVCGDIVDVLRARADPFDIILAADVFIYVGALHDLFEQCRRLLASEGAFLFSIEACEGERYVLRPSGRFAHSLAYIRALAREHGFNILLEDPTPIRRQEQGVIHGFLCLLR